MLATVLEFAHQQIRQVLQAGDTVLDATCGNGHDTLFLAQTVGKTGTVFAFDSQQAALAASRSLLAQHQQLSQVRLIHACHSTLNAYIHTPLNAAMFNFGYLPGGDKSITTTATTSLIAIQKTIAQLQQGAVMSLVLYAGHPQGKTEAAAILDFLRTYPQTQLAVVNYQFLNRPSHAAHTLVCQKKSSHHANAAYNKMDEPTRSI